MILLCINKARVQVFLALSPNKSQGADPQWMDHVCNTVVKDDKIPEGWRSKSLLAIIVQGQERCFGMWLLPKH